MVLRFRGVAASQLWSSTLLCFFSVWLPDDYVTSMDYIPDKTSLSLCSGICTWQTSRRTLGSLGYLERRPSCRGGRTHESEADEMPGRHALMSEPVERHCFCSCTHL